MLGGLRPWPKWPRPRAGAAAMHDPKLISCQKVSVATRLTISFLIVNGLCVCFSIIILPLAALILGDSSIG